MVHHSRCACHSSEPAVPHSRKAEPRGARTPIVVTSHTIYVTYATVVNPLCHTAEEQSHVVQENPWYKKTHGTRKNMVQHMVQRYMVQEHLLLLHHSCCACHSSDPAVPHSRKAESHGARTPIFITSHTIHVAHATVVTQLCLTAVKQSHMVQGNSLL